MSLATFHNAGLCAALARQEVRALSLLDTLAELTLAGNPLLERLGPRAVDVLVRNACPAVATLDGRELSGGRRSVKRSAVPALVRMRACGTQSGLNKKV